MSEGKIQIIVKIIQSLSIKTIKKKHELNHKLLDCDEIMFLSWYRFFERFLQITSKYMPSICCPIMDLCVLGP